MAEGEEELRDENSDGQATYHAQGLLLIIDLPIKQPDNPLYILQLPQQLDLASVSSDSILAAIFEIHLLQREHLVVLGHDPVHVRTAPFP